MNDPDWVNGLPRAKLSQKYAFQAIHILAPLRNAQGIAAVVLQTETEYLRAPAQTEACFELCLRHLNRLQVPWPASENLTVMTLLANRATEALRLPNRFVPTAEGNVLDMCEHNSQAPPSPVCAKEDMREDTTRALCAMHMDVTACPGWLEPSSNVASPMSQCADQQTMSFAALAILPELLTEMPALPTEMSELPTETQPLPKELPALPTETQALPTETPALLTESQELLPESAVLSTDSPALQQALPELTTESPALEAYPPATECESPRNQDVAMPCAELPHNHAASDAAPGTRSLSRRAKRRAVLKARKQQRLQQ